MADRVDYYFRQRVTEAELDLGFELLEKADHNLAADIGLFGVVSGAVPTPHLPVADLSIDLTAPGRAYDRLGQRVFFGTGQRVDVSVDLTGVPTQVPTSGQERWLGVFLRFERLLSDPRTDGNSQQVYFRRDESFELVVRQGPAAAVGSAPKVALVDDELLVCDVRLRAGQTQVMGADIDVSRRQAFVIAQGSAIGIAATGWLALNPAATTVQAAFNSADAVLRAHLTGATGSRHASSDIDYLPHGFVAATTVKAAIDELVDDLTTSAAGNPGAARVGADAVVGSPNLLAAGTVDGQLSQLLSFLNLHVSAVTAAHNASAIAVQDTGNNLDATNVETALAEVADAFEGDHFRANEASPGQHRVIRQPVLGSGRVLIWDSQGAGGAAGRLRVYSDVDAVWFLLGASWNGSVWVRDVAGQSVTGWYLSKSEFNLFYENSAATTFTSFTRFWRLPMAATPNSTWETSGTIQEVARCGLRITNPLSSTWVGAYMATAVQFRSRFPATPSSITLARTEASATVPAATAISSTRDGFIFNIYASSLSGAEVVYWFGDYTATA